ncbi:MAG: hypothetical protein ACREPE_09355 [Lysobacter sp.]
MIHASEMALGYDAHAFLVAFCTVAMDLYPELTWDEVEPRLKRSWERYQGDGVRQWAEVRDLARERWEAGER